MSEIEKMYELAGVNKKCIDKRYEKCTGVCYNCKYFVYPPFTAEKQLEVIKWLASSETHYIREISRPRYLDTKDWFIETVDTSFQANDSFEGVIAGVINLLWQNLTKEERKQIRNILKGLE